VKLRIITAVVGIPLVLAVNQVGGLVFAASVMVVALVGGTEAIRLIRATGRRPMAATLLSFVVLLPLAPLVSKTSGEAMALGVFVLAIVIASAQSLRRSRYELSDLALTLFFIAYIGLLLQYLPLLRAQAQGSRWVIYALLLTWAYDTGAFLVGRSVGRTPFMQHISPRKTWEGVLGGGILSVLAGLLALPFLQLSWWQAITVALACSGLAQAGDLIESFIKRQAGTKDSGALLPGHGGILDRIDALLLVAPAVYYFGLAYARFT
jgi:phosphatidate cytidylyltransferase